MAHLSHELSVDEAPVQHAPESPLSSQAEEQHQALLAQRDARIAELEQQLVEERRLTQEQSATGASGAERTTGTQ